MNREIQRLIKYGIVGVSNVAIDFAFLNLFLWFHLNLYLAISLAFTIAATNSYFLNRNWTFKDKKADQVGRQYILFLIVSITGLLLNNFIVFLFVKYIFIINLVLTANAAKVVATGFVVIWNYCINRFFVFQAPSPTLLKRGSATSDESKQ